MIVNKNWYWSPEWGHQGFEILNRDSEQEPDVEDFDVEDTVDDYQVDLSDFS